MTSAATGSGSEPLRVARVAVSSSVSGTTDSKRRLCRPRPRATRTMPLLVSMRPSSVPSWVEVRLPLDAIGTRTQSSL